MQVLATVREMRAWRAAVPGTLGFVPTMGYLHAGHMALVHAACAETDTVAASIFVNPMQFGPTEDLARYPRDPERDLAMLRDAGVACVFMPAVDEVYPPGFAAAVDVGALTARLEGRFRPGHFRGVATVVCKLFNIVRPDVAYFGQKDAQQLLVIRQMVRDLDMPVQVHAVPTVREPDGLALSSRNVYLSPDERGQALCLSRALRLAEQRFASGERDAGRIRRAMRRLIRTHPAARIDYVSVADVATLDELAVIDRAALVSMAVRIGGTRLIDNTILTP